MVMPSKPIIRLVTLQEGGLSLERIYAALTHQETLMYHVFLQRAFASGHIQKPGFFNILKKIVKVGQIYLPNLGQQRNRVAMNLHTWLYSPLTDSELPNHRQHLLSLEKWTVVEEVL